jgi:putative tryptophan/tyrosine transport system substrate-binding protein
MKRKIINLALCAVLFALCSSVESQQPKKIAKIAYLAPSTPAAAAHLVEAFRQGLRELGYVEGKTVVLELRYGEARAERLSELARELAGLKMDVIVTSTDVAIAAVKRETQTIPIVMANSTDPVGTGFVASLAHPGGNITGLSSISPELSGKRLELLREVVPGLSRVAFLWNPDVRGAVLDYKETEDAAGSLRLQLQSVEVVRAEDFDRAFSAITKERAGVNYACSESLRVREAEPDRELRTEESAAVHVCTKGVRGRWGPHVLWTQHSRHAPPRCHVCG